MASYWPMDLRPFADSLIRFPWKSTGRTLVERFREDRLGLTASSLTFTTTMALVPLFTVALAIFTAFPMFSKLQESLQGWLVQSLIPDAIARQVIGYLNQFAGKASRLGIAGLGALLVTALALVLTIDRTLNNIWRVRRTRPLGQRVLVYWAVMTLGPLLLGASLSFSSYVLSASKGLVSDIPGALQFTVAVLEFFLLFGGLAALYRYVPNAPVQRAHAVAGGSFAAIGIEVARKLLAFYISKVGTYSAVYGTFATLPILLVWIYTAWVIVLLGAVVAAYLPSLIAGTTYRGGPGWQFQLAIEVLQELAAARKTTTHGLTFAQVAHNLHTDTLHLEPVLETLIDLDWVGGVNEARDEDATRYVLLADPATARIEPLMQKLLLPETPVTARLWGGGHLAPVRIADVI